MAAHPTSRIRQQYQKRILSENQAANDPRLWIGLGSAQRIETLEILWPSGRVDRHAGLPTDASYLIREGETTPRPLPGFEPVNQESGVEIGPRGPVSQRVALELRQLVVKDELGIV